MQKKLTDKILNSLLVIQVSEKPDKFGRVLGTIYLEDAPYLSFEYSINQWMLDNTKCNLYDGGKKRKFDD